MKLETVFFRIWRAICIACQFSIYNHYMVFSVEIIEKEILASNASVATNAKNVQTAVSGLDIFQAC